MPSSAKAKPAGSAPVSPPASPRDKTHWLYLAVIVAALLGIAVGFAFGGKEGFAVARGRRCRADRVLVQPRRHGDLSDDGLRSMWPRQ